LLSNFLADLFRRLFVDPAFGKSDSNGLRVGLPLRIHCFNGDLRPVVGAGRRQPLAIGASQTRNSRNGVHLPSLDLTSRWLMTSLSACAQEIIASLSWAGGRRLATRCMVSGTVSAWIVVAVAWPEIAAWMVAIICSGLRHSPMMMSVGWRRIAPAMKSSKLFTLRGISLCEMVLVTLSTRSCRNSTGSAH